MASNVKLKRPTSLANEALSVRFAHDAENYAKAAMVLALQLLFCFEVRALSGSLVSSTPE
jgi:hypothetical protein